MESSSLSSPEQHVMEVYANDCPTHSAHNRKHNTQYRDVKEWVKFFIPECQLGLFVIVEKTEQVTVITDSRAKEKVADRLKQVIARNSCRCLLEQIYFYLLNIPL